MDEVLSTVRKIFDGIDLEQEKRKAEEDLKKNIVKLRETLDGIMKTLEAIIEIKDPYTSGHQRKAALLAAAISEELGLNRDEIDTLKTIAMIHDIGKISIPVSILAKPGDLSRLEYDMIKTHPQVGFDILKEIDFPWPITDVVLQHHERLNGSGYPQGLRRKEIMFEAKILAVADVVEAMTSYRPYRPAFNLEEAVREITRGRSRLYDLKVVDACIRVVNGKKFKL
jgi:putative nucleotidyltransferase with HDIG domain